MEETTAAERHWIRGIQYQYFQREISYLQRNRTPKPLLVDQFGLCIDEHQIVRCRGRFNNSSLPLGTKNPMLLPHNHHYVKSLIPDVHHRLKHSRVNDTLATICEEFWILRGRQAVKNVIRHYIICKKMDGRAYPPVNIMPDLPSV